MCFLELLYSSIQPHILVKGSIQLKEIVKLLISIRSMSNNGLENLFSLFLIVHYRQIEFIKKEIISFKIGDLAPITMYACCGNYRNFL